MRTLAISLFLAGAASAADLPITRVQIRRVDVSSTSAAQAKGKALYLKRNLIDGHDWSAWGSRAEETAGAWLQVQFDRVRYVSRVDFVPGHARDARTFRGCARPATLVVSAAGETRRFELADERWRQSLTIEPPLAGHSLRITVETVHGEARAAGVCLSELRLRAPADPTARIPGLPSRLELSISLLADDSRARHARRELLAIGAPAVPALQRALDPANPNLASRAAELLGRIGDRGAIPALAPLAEHPDQQLRHAGLWALSALGSGAHIDAVRAWFDETAGKERDHAFEALARSGDARVLEVVVAELVDGSERRRAAAAEHLGRFGADAVSAVEPLLRSNVRRERAAALYALGSVEHPDAETLLRDGLADTDNDSRAAAVRGLARRGGADAHARIATLWSSRYSDVRGAVAEALGRFGDPEDKETLELLASDGSMSVRRAAARSLGRIGASARPTLRRLALLGPEGATASAAAEGLLESVPAPSTAVTLLRSRHEEVRTLAADAIRAHGPAGRLALVRAVTGEVDLVRGPAATLLRQIGADAAPDLLVAAHQAGPAALPEVLGLLAGYGDPAGVGFAVPLVREGADMTVRVAAIRALQHCAAAGTQARVGAQREQIEGVLLGALDDPSPEVHLAAIEALGTMQVGQATEALATRLGSEDRSIRRAAVRALGTIRQRVALGPLVDAFQHTNAREDDPALREDLVVAIGRIGGRASLKVLIGALEDSDARVSQAAERALQ